MIYVTDYITRHKGIPTFTEKDLEGLEDEINVYTPRRKPIFGRDYLLGWGQPPVGVRYGVMETGFFRDAGHIDSVGLYQFCSLNLPEAQEAIRSFNAPIPAAKILRDNNIYPSKYHQVRDGTVWDGVVLAGQRAEDRSIWIGHSKTDYYDFVQGACEYYGKHLFIKMHPCSSPETMKFMEHLASDYGCKAAKSGHNLLQKCKFVITFNSTFVVDCLLHGVPVAQFAPGYFWNVKPVLYTHYQYPDDVPRDPDLGQKVCDFLIWRYCFLLSMKGSKWVDMIRHFARSRQLFPMTDEFCYATNARDLK